VTDSAPPASSVGSAALLSVPPAGVPTLNRERLATIARDASPEFLLELAQLFTKDVEERIGLLASIVNARDVRATASVAHRVQSAATSLGVMRLRSLAASLEKHAHGEDWRRVELALERVQSEFSHVKQLLEAMREGADAPR
jgi:HPt (histidine-containing phosphotransfer) domain-containing protein